MQIKCPRCGGETEIRSVRRPDFEGEQIQLALCVDCKKIKQVGLNMPEYADTDEGLDETAEYLHEIAGSPMKNFKRASRRDIRGDRTESWEPEVEPEPKRGRVRILPTFDDWSAPEPEEPEEDASTIIAQMQEARRRGHGDV